jgi:hypothetical protein
MGSIKELYSNVRVNHHYIRCRLTDELVIFHDSWVELESDRFSMACSATAHITIRHMLIVVSAYEPDARFENAFILFDWVVLQEDMFSTPEAPRGEGGDFRR